MAKKKERVKVFVSNSCVPCEEVKQLVKDGRFNREEIDLIDLETEEGFPWIEKLGLKRVPSAYIGKKSCKIEIDHEENTLIITCPGEELSETPVENS